MSTKSNEPAPLPPLTRPPAQDPPSRAGEAQEQAPLPLDFAKLDLSVEKVEERISPSETNVFDK